MLDAISKLAGTFLKMLAGLRFCQLCLFIDASLREFLKAAWYPFSPMRLSFYEWLSELGNEVHNFLLRDTTNYVSLFLRNVFPGASIPASAG